MRAIPHGAEKLLRVSGIGFGLHYAWEMAQMPLFVDGEGQPFQSGLAFSLHHCFIPAVGDVVVVVSTFLVGWRVHRRADWIASLSWRDILWITLSLLLLAILVEVVNVRILKQWEYSEQMPVVPGINIALLPLIQLPLLTIITFLLARQG